MNEKKLESYQNEAVDGANAETEYRMLTGAFMELKANVMDSFENKETLDIEELQEVHRTYRNLCKLDDFFMMKIRKGKEAQNRLNSQKG